MRQALLCLALLFLPAASAQVGEATLTVESIDYSPEAVEPHEYIPINISWVYEVSDPATAAAAYVQHGSTSYHWEPECEGAELIWTGQRSGAISFMPDQTRYEESTTIQVALPRDVRGQEPIRCTLSGQVEAAGNTITASNTVTPSVNVTSNWYGLLEASMPVRLQQVAPGQEVLYDLDLRLWANSATRVEVRDVSEAQEGYALLPPEPIIFDGLSNGAQKGQVVRVSAPASSGWANSQGDFQIEVVYGPLDGSEEHVVPITFLLRTVGCQSSIEACHGPGDAEATKESPMPLVGVLVALGLASRQRLAMER